MSAANDALACAEACQRAQDVVARARRGDALPDELHVELQALRAAGDGERLRCFTRTVQKAIESPGRRSP